MLLEALLLFEGSGYQQCVNDPITGFALEECAPEGWCTNK